MSTKVAIASDHAGMKLREEAEKVLLELGLTVENLGPLTSDSVDYPDFAKKVADLVGQGKAQFGLLVCGTGTGMAIAANKVEGVRAAKCTSEFEARMARAHNDANILCLGERITGPGLGAAIVRAFFEQSFEGGRHAQRVQKIRDLEGT